MSTTAETATQPRERLETAFNPAGVVFDYRVIAKAKTIPDEVLRSIEDEVAREFPNDPMLMELHVLRAINAYDKLTCKDEE